MSQKSSYQFSPISQQKNKGPWFTASLLFLVVVLLGFLLYAQIQLERQHQAAHATMLQREGLKERTVIKESPSTTSSNLKAEPQKKFSSSQTLIIQSVLSQQNPKISSKSQILPQAATKQDVIAKKISSATNGQDQTAQIKTTESILPKPSQTINPQNSLMSGLLPNPAPQPAFPAPVVINEPSQNPAEPQLTEQQIQLQIRKYQNMMNNLLRKRSKERRKQLEPVPEAAIAEAQAAAQAAAQILSEQTRPRITARSNGITPSTKGITPSTKPAYKSPYQQIASISPQQIALAGELSGLRKMQNPLAVQKLQEKQKAYFQKKYNTSQYKEQPFCIMVPSYNNVANNRYMQNLKSILQQDYSNYHIVFIDDNSNDGTGQKVREFARKQQISDKKLQIYINDDRKMAMANIYKAATSYCKPYEIFMIVDGDDELLGTQVLKHFNAVFQKDSLWVMYTNFILASTHSVGYSRPYSPTVIQNKQFRKSGFVISHLRAFYSKLLTQVKEQDLKDDNGNWFKAGNDVAMYMPILQQAHYNMAYVPELSYVYNSNTGNNNHIVKPAQQKGNQMKVKARKGYESVTQLFTAEEAQQLKDSLNAKVEIKDLSIDPNVPVEPVQPVSIVVTFDSKQTAVPVPVEGVTAVPVPAVSATTMPVTTALPVPVASVAPVATQTATPTQTVAPSPSPSQSLSAFGGV